jgi:hypothetical protein
MRPYLVLIAAVLMAVAAFGQQPFSHPGYSSCFYGCGPFVPLLTTPEISLQQFSPNPVGASNATTGLIAGATNATLSQIQGSTSSVYTVPVWYQGGAPLITPEVRLYPETIGREGHPMHVAKHEERRHEEVREETREERRHVERSHAERSHAEAEEEKREEARASWAYLTGPSAAAAANESKGVRRPGHVYTNDDVTRQNDKNGTVKYDGKTEKI